MPAKTIRKVFTKLRDAVPLPDLIEAQKNSYQWFLQQGLSELFEEISPIKDFIGRDFELNFKEYYLDEPKFDEVTSKEKNLSYESPLRVKVELINRKSEKSVEQETGAIMVADEENSISRTTSLSPLSPHSSFCFIQPLSLMLQTSLLFLTDVVRLPSLQLLLPLAC